MKNFIYLITLFFLISIISPGCNPVASTPPTATSTNTPTPIPPSITEITIAEKILNSQGGIFEVPGETNPSDTLDLTITVQDDDIGNVTVMNRTKAYIPSKDHKSTISFRLVVPSDLKTNEIPLHLSSGEDIVEYSLVFIPGKKWPPWIEVENPTGATGEITLSIQVNDLNGVKTIGDLTVEQVFNYQDTGDKQIKEYISNNDLSPFDIKLIEPGFYEVSFKSDWPGRFPLIFTIVDEDGNKIEERTPIEVYWAKQPFEVRGVALDFWGDPRDDKFGPRPDLIFDAFRTISNLNANYVVIPINGAMEFQTSNDIFPCYELPASDIWCFTPSNDQLSDWIQSAHDEGLSVVVAPFIVADHFKFEGFQIIPDEWDTFFRSYSDYVIEYARISELNSVEILVASWAMGDHNIRNIGDWRNLFNQIRDIYSGKLLVSSFWPHPTFWDSLDFFGAHFFHGGTSRFDPTVDELKTNFESIMDYYVIPFWERYNKPIIFTELGCWNIDGAAIEPLTIWNRLPNNNIITDNQEQVDYYEAALRTMTDLEGVSGTFVWAYNLYPDDRLQINEWFAPNTPVRDLVRIWFYTR